MSAAAPALGVVTIAGADAERSKRGGLSREAKGIISAAFQGRDRGASKLAALLKGPAAKEVDAALPQVRVAAKLTGCGLALHASFAHECRPMPQPCIGPA